MYQLAGTPWLLQHTSMIGEFSLIRPANLWLSKKKKEYLAFVLCQVVNVFLFAILLKV